MCDVVHSVALCQVERGIMGHVGQSKVVIVCEFHSAKTVVLGKHRNCPLSTPVPFGKSGTLT